MKRNPLVEEHEAWRARMAALTQRLRDNPHRRERDHGPDGIFHRGFFVQGVERKQVELALLPDIAELTTDDKAR